MLNHTWSRSYHIVSMVAIGVDNISYYIIETRRDSIIQHAIMATNCFRHNLDIILQIQMSKKTVVLVGIFLGVSSRVQSRVICTIIKKCKIEDEPKYAIAYKK